MHGLLDELMGITAKRRWHVALVAFLGLLYCPSAQIGGTTLWADVCTSEEYNNYQLELCPDVFRASTLAFNPLYPGADANITLIIQPTVNLLSEPQRIQFVDLRLPGFDPLGSVNQNDALIRDLSVTANNPTGLGDNTATSYNTYLNPVFHSPASYMLSSGILRLTAISGKTIRADKYTEVIICCLKLPMYSPMDNTAFRISAPTSLLTAAPILDEAIKSSPYIDPGFQWDFLMVQFHPPIARALTKIDLTMRPANDLSDRCRIILHLPGVTRVPSGNGDVGFNTESSGNPNDWMFFAYLARWDQTARTITFFLREGKVLPAFKQITVSTKPGEFRLPTEIESNWHLIKVEARSSDGVDEIIRATSVRQSTHVPHVRFFEFSSLSYHNPVPGMKSNVDLNFRSNRPMFAGTTIYMRLSGFQAEVIEVPLKGILKVHFFNQVATMHLPENILELKVNKTLYSNEFTAAITFIDLIIPPALYVNDSSLLIWNSDPDCPRQSIDMSPEVGNGFKTFILSKLQFSPMEPRRAANVTVMLRPSIVFFQGDSIALHLYGFFAFQTDLPLSGPDAYRIKNSMAQWYAADHLLILEVAENQIIGTDRTFTVSIAREHNFRIPDKLSKNDGILRIEGRGALITKEPIKKSPMIGDPKYVIDSRIEFEAVDPAATRSIARITFTLILNCDVLPNSTMIITMGGILRHPPSCDSVGVNYCPDRSASVRLSGKNAPLFVGGVGQWYQEEVKLVVQIIPTVQIYSGEFIRFFLERDQFFQLPFAAYQNDPSFRLEVPEAGVPEQPFNFSTKINQVPKGFDDSEIFYGDRGMPALPNSGTIITFRFVPNVDLPEISVVRFTLPGFTSPDVYLPLMTVEVPQRGELYIAEFINQAHWRQLQYTLDLEVPPRQTIYRATTSVFRINGFRLPADPLLPNDARLTIAVIRNQIINVEPIKTSPRVVDRTFTISEFIYRPPQQQSIFQLVMLLQPTVNITEDQTITIELPGFRNSLAKRNVHIMGASRRYIRDSMGEWNATTQVLTINVAVGMEIPAFEDIQLQIEESQGFILPASLDANDTRIKIASKNNIETQPIKISPMVGNGPYTAHRFCMYQYEHGVRTRTPICQSATDCSPPLTDPCSQAELERCGCETRLDHVWPFKVMGFNLQESDELSFLPLNQLCGYADPGPPVLSTFSSPTSKTVSDDRSSVEYHNIQSIDTGHYRLCAKHDGKMFDIGILVVRPACTNAMVMLGGTCVEHCPKTKVPIAGQCRRDPNALVHRDADDLMIPVRMAEPPTSGGSLVDKPSDDPEVRYFIYRYTYELARLLDCDPTRILVASLTRGSLIVNTIFKSVGTETAQAASTERSPFGLISLLYRLQQDQSSSLYLSEFFKYIDREQMAPPLLVRKCDDDTYRVFCPYTGAILSTGLSIVIFIGIVLLFMLLVSLFFLALWSIDRDRPSQYDEDLLEKIRRDPNQVEPPLQAEYAKSWLEGRFMGEEWERARKVKMLPIKN